MVKRLLIITLTYGYSHLGMVNLKYSMKLKKKIEVIKSDSLELYSSIAFVFYFFLLVTHLFEFQKQNVDNFNINLSLF